MALDGRDSRRGIGALLRELAEGSTALVRDEIRLAKLEIASAVSGIGKGTACVAAGAAATATQGASTKSGAALDDMVATLLGGVHQALDDRVSSWVDELKGAIGAPARAGSTLPVRAD